MANACKCCIHKQRNKIDKEIVRGKPHAQIARKFNVGELSVRGHARNHLPKTMVKNKEARELLHSSTLLKEMQGLVDTAKGILNRAENNGHSMISLAAIKELRQIFEFWTKINLYLKESKDRSELIGKRERTQIEVLKCLSVDELETMNSLWQKAIDTYNGVHVVDTIDVVDKTIVGYKQQSRYRHKKRV